MHYHDWVTSLRENIKSGEQQRYKRCRTCTEERELTKWKPKKASTQLEAMKGSDE